MNNFLNKWSDNFPLIITTMIISTILVAGWVVWSATGDRQWWLALLTFIPIFFTFFFSLFFVIKKIKE